MVCHSVSTSRRSCSSLAAASFRRQRDALATIEQGCDLHLTVHGALAADLGRMRRQNRADQRALEEVAQGIGTDARSPRMGERLGQHAGAAALVGAHLADVVLVLGDVGEVGEIAEGADDPHRLGGRHAVEDLLELAAGEPVLVAVESDRGLADAFHQIEQFRPLLVAHRVAENAPEQADVVPQPHVRFQRLDVLRAVGALLGGVG
ncbi:antitoxin (DNA-binding transcriptional repressor) of toxin-antitoxin stability system [Bradyrhizobium sp. GM7.3]